MDKLQPLIKHRFWILAALVPPLCIFGYYKANGAMKAATKTRTEVLDGVITAIPPGTDANPTWTDAAQVLNEDYKAAVYVELVRVWDEQQARITWPPSMERYVPATYRGDFPDEAGFTYKDEYPNLVADQHASVEPITPEGKGFSGKIWLDQQLIPRHVFGPLSVPSKKIWDAQEDLWYLQLILDAIRNVNRSAENAAKAPIRKIYKIELRGGTGESSIKKSGSTTGGSSSMEGMHGEMESMDMSQVSAGSRTGQSGLSAAKVAFDPAEEFGPQTTQASQSASTSGAADAAHGAMPSRPGGGGNRELIRYIKLDEKAKFRERGFYLSVLIDQKKVPDFLVELSNSDWPIRIVRFHQGPSPEQPGSAGNLMDNHAAGYEGLGSAVPTDAFDAFDQSAFADPTTLGEMPTTDMPIGPSPLVTSEQMAGLFTHPDLVQLDVCGVITFYNPPAEDILSAVQASTSAAPDADAAEAANPGAAESPASFETGDAEPSVESAAAPESSEAVVPDIPGTPPTEEAEGADSDTTLPSATEDATDGREPASPDTSAGGNDPSAAPDPE